MDPRVRSILPESKSRIEGDNGLYKISTSVRGRGLFATSDIPPRSVIHTAPCILITKEEYEKHGQHTILEHYLFNCRDGDRLLALGHGSLFNHDSKLPNVEYKLNKAALEISYYSGHKVILKGDELCIFYGNKLWFNDGCSHNADRSNESTSSGESQDIDGLPSFMGRMEL